MCFLARLDRVMGDRLRGRWSDRGFMPASPVF